MNAIKASIVEQQPLRLVTAKATVFPDDTSEAFKALEAPLDTLRGRKFYGLAFRAEHGIDYYAGLVPADEMEERRFVELGFSVIDVEGGPCARMKIKDWRTKTEQFAPVFQSMAEQHGVDSSRPEMEFYRSLAEVHLLSPVPSGRELP